MKIIYVLFVALLMGCTAEEITCKNETIYINNTIIKEVEKIVNVSPTYIRKYTILENATQKLELVDCKKKFRQCDIALHYQDEELFDCLTNNNTKYSDNLTGEYEDCVEERDEYKEMIDKINDVVG